MRSVSTSSRLIGLQHGRSKPSVEHSFIYCRTLTLTRHWTVTRLTYYALRRRRPMRLWLVVMLQNMEWVQRVSRRQWQDMGEVMNDCVLGHATIIITTNVGVDRGWSGGRHHQWRRAAKWQRCQEFPSAEYEYLGLVIEDWAGEGGSLESTTIAYLEASLIIKHYKWLEGPCWFSRGGCSLLEHPKHHPTPLEQNHWKQNWW